MSKISSAVCSVVCSVVCSIAAAQSGPIANSRLEPSGTLSGLRSQRLGKTVQHEDGREQEGRLTGKQVPCPQCGQVDGGNLPPLGNFGVGKMVIVDGGNPGGIGTDPGAPANESKRKCPKGQFWLLTNKAKESGRCVPLSQILDPRKSD
jgi:hypothetical protein